MIKNVLSNMGGVGLYGVLSICIFFGVFLSALIWAFRLKKSYLDSMCSLPLADEGSGANSVDPEQAEDSIVADSRGDS